MRLLRQTLTTKASKFGRYLPFGQTPLLYYSEVFRQEESSTCSTLPFRKHGRSLFSTMTTGDSDHVVGRFGAYAEEYAQSIENPEAFWKKAADQLEWHKKPSTILEYNENEPWFSKWFPDGEINMSYNCLDVHVRDGRGDQDAIIYDSPVTEVKERISYRELLNRVSTFAGGLSNLGVEAGDRVVIYMPMIPEAIVAMLACGRIGAAHSVVFGGFASKELANRITDCEPKVIISASAGVEPTRIVPYKPLLDEALALSEHKVTNTVIVQRKNVDKCSMTNIDVDYDDLMRQSQPIEALPVVSSHYHNILYTSGTTGTPKGVVRETGGYAVALKYAMGAFYDIQPGECFWTASDIGWIVGHLGVYAPLLQGATTIMYEGKPVGTPDAGAFWRVISEYNVKTFFVAPTAFRAIKQADPHAELSDQYDLSSLKAVFLAGEHSDPATLHYCEKALRKYPSTRDTIVDHWWQTELTPAIGNTVGLGHIPVRYGGCTGPAPGYDMRILDDKGEEVGPNVLGSMVLKNPLPPGTLATLYKNDDRFVNSYMSKFPGYYDTSDSAFLDDDGYVHIVGRTDDVINTAGHRLSTGAMEEILMEHEDVSECAIFPMKDDVKGEIPIGLVILNKDSTIDHDLLKQDLIMMVRHELGPVAAFKKVAVVRALPKTRSGKILRGTMSKIANGEEYKITPTIEDATIFDYLGPEIQQLVASD